MKSCPLCNIDTDKEQKVIIENKFCMFLQKPQEILIGSGLIVPKEHRETVFDLNVEEWNATYTLLHQVKEFLDESYAPDGYNIGWNVGKVGGQHIMHAHLHIIPRFKEEPYANKGIRHWLKGSENKHFFT